MITGVSSPHVKRKRVTTRKPEKAGNIENLVTPLVAATQFVLSMEACQLVSKVSASVKVIVL